MSSGNKIHSLIKVAKYLLEWIPFNDIVLWLEPDKVSKSSPGQNEHDIESMK